MLEEMDGHRLADEALEQVAGGAGDVTVLTCPDCKAGRVAVPVTGSVYENCPNCRATLCCANGRIWAWYSYAESGAPDYDPEDAWL